MDPSLIAPLIETLIEAAENRDYGAIDKRWWPLQDALCPNDPGREGLDIEASDLSPKAKGALYKLLNLGTLHGPRAFHRPAYEGLPLLRSCLAAVSPQESPNDPRDKFMLNARRNGKPYKWIIDQLKHRPKWEYIDSAPGVRRAIIRYCERSGETPPVNVKSR